MTISNAEKKSLEHIAVLHEVSGKSALSPDEKAKLSRIAKEIEDGLGEEAKSLLNYL